MYGFVELAVKVEISNVEICKVTVLACRIPLESVTRRDLSWRLSVPGSVEL